MKMDNRSISLLHKDIQPSILMDFGIDIAREENLVHNRK